MGGLQMKMDYDVLRDVMLKIEEEYVDVALYNIEVKDYDMKTIAYHCKLLYEAGFVSDYAGNYYDDGLQEFGVGPLTFKGNEYLNKIREKSTWEKTKKVVLEGGVPGTIEILGKVATSIIEKKLEKLLE
jgi:hypothetical protein